MLRHLPLLVTGLLLGLTGRPAEAAPRLTLSLEKATLHTTLRALRAHYGWEVTGPQGAGTEGFVEAPGAPQSRFVWKEADGGTVLRSVAEAFRLEVAMPAPDVVRFTAGTAPARGVSYRGKRLMATLQEVIQREKVLQKGAAGTPEVTRSLELRLTLRTPGADSLALADLASLRVVDDRGRTLELEELPNLRLRGEGVSDLPDERTLTLKLTGFDPAAARLAVVEGKVTLFRTAETHRLEIPREEALKPAKRRAGPLELQVAGFQVSGRNVSGEYRLQWPEGTHLVVGTEPEKATGICFARLPNGRRVDLPGQVIEQSLAPGQPRTVRVRLSPFQLPEEPVAFVWDLPHRARPDGSAEFRFANVPLPFASSLEAPKDTGTLLIRLARSISLREGELSVGVSRRVGQGWGPIRWTSVELSPTGEARLRGVAPAQYRVRLRFRRRDAGGKLGPPTMFKSVPATVAVTAARESRIQAVP